MTITITSSVQLVGITCLALLALVRAAMLRSQGVAILAVDGSRTTIQTASDAFAFFTLLYWLYATVTYCIAPQQVFVPRNIDVIVLTSAATKWSGVAVTSVAVMIYGLGVLNMGKSWRLGIDRHMTAPLVTGGIFAFSRNPIYLGFDLLFIGRFLIHGRLVLLLLLLILLPLLHNHILREECFLATKYGDEYRAYCDRVGRYITW